MEDMLENYLFYDRKEDSQFPKKLVELCQHRIQKDYKQVVEVFENCLKERYNITDV